MPNDPLINPTQDISRVKGVNEKECENQLESCKKTVPFGDVQNGKLNGHVVYFNGSGSRCGECNMNNGVMNGTFDYYGENPYLVFSALYSMGSLKQIVKYEDKFRYIYCQEKMDGQYSYAREDIESNEIIRYNVDAELLAHGPAIRISNGVEKKTRFEHGVEKSSVNFWPYTFAVCSILLVGSIVFMFLPFPVCLACSCVRRFHKQTREWTTL